MSTVKQITWPPVRYILVCCAEREGGIPSCGRKGREVFLALQAEVDSHGAIDEWQVTACGCLGVCAMGPVAVVDGSSGRIWVDVEPSDVSLLFQAILGESQNQETSASSPKQS